VIARRDAVSNVREGTRRPRRSGETGSAYLFALLMILVMVAGSQVALQNMYTQGRRAREDDMIWRGNQYVRAVRLYYRKTGHYPQSLDDLKTGLPELHFLRYVAYKDPMAKDKDGEWRLIYVNATGQIIGSSHYATLQQMAIMELNGGKLPAATATGALVGTPVSSMASGTGGTGATSAPNPAPGGNSSGQSPPGSTTDNSAPGGGQAPNTGQSSPPDQASSSDQPVNPLSLLKPTGPVDGPVLGAFLTGVGGGTGSDALSIKVVDGGKKYKDWEFIWNPLLDQARAVQLGLSSPGQSTGMPTGTGGNGTTSPNGVPTGFGGAIMPPPTSQPPPQNP
jgi:hypothetical protein